MDDMAAYYPPPQPQPPPPASSHYPYYQPPPPPHPVAPPPSHHHLPPPYFPHNQSPYSSYAPPPLHSPATHDEVRTLFVAGLPEDVKPREIYNLFREFQGYESSHLRNPSQTSQSSLVSALMFFLWQPFAFAVFLDQHSAIGAMQALNGMVFDLEKGSTLYIDLAKSNSRPKRSRADDERFGSDKRARGSSFPRAPTDSSVGSMHMPGMGNSAYNIGYPSTPSQRNLDSRAVNDIGPPHSHNSSASHLPLNSPPCPTLFVANLGPSCTEQELIHVFSRFPGFLKVKMQGTYGAPVAFVDFEDTACSTGALNHLQGTILYSSPAGEGIRLEFAKSRMGMRKRSD
ncbi:RNA-binding protein L isoform X2 [Humulus lupulus]|uniref:RNA-binding protein L isoform X2 n=1 Tax=Humulus lupulus TaxID=3486 RepID=UPI002B418622|nr:RNA-binding protein L isoform X2 [Humulus lupulus]